MNPSVEYYECMPWYAKAFSLHDRVVALQCALAARTEDPTLELSVDTLAKLIGLAIERTLAHSMEVAHYGRASWPIMMDYSQSLREQCADLMRMHLEMPDFWSCMNDYLLIELTLHVKYAFAQNNVLELQHARYKVEPDQWLIRLAVNATL